MPRFGQHCTACTWVDEITVAPFENPPCPECGGGTERLWTSSSATVVGDDIPGGMVLHNLGPEPITVYSHTERRALMQERGLREFVRASDSPDGRISNWDVVSPHTLEETKKLLERVGQESGRGRADHGDRPINLKMTVRDVGTFSAKDTK